MRKSFFSFTILLCCLCMLFSGCQTAGGKKEEKVDMNGKRIIFIGDSFVYAGKAVLSNSGLTQKERDGDTGYFYQLCKAKGMEVSVTNWTYGGTGLTKILNMYSSVLKDRNYDFVVFSGGRNSANTYAALSETLDTFMSMFREVNPDVKFYYLVSSGAHNISVLESFPIDILNNLDAIEEKGITIVDWGKMVADIIRGKVTVPGGTQTYNNHTFVKYKSDTDGYHPNQLTGYLTALMTYCAITGESAIGQPYAFWNDTSLSSQFDSAKFVANSYTMGPTNYPDVFASEADMNGLQQLIDQYLAAKDYRNYNFTQADANG